MRAEQIENLGHLPDDAVVDVSIWPVMAGIGINTAWDRAKNDPTFPKPVRLSNRCTRWKLGDVRRFLAGAQVTEKKE